MAKKSMIEKNNRRIALTAKFRERRAALVHITKDQNASMADKVEAQKKLAKMPRDASRIRVRNRCYLTGRSRAYYRKFGLCRIQLRDEALKGNLPGVVKASW